MRMRPAFGSSRSRSVIEDGTSAETRIYRLRRLPQIVLVHLAGLVRLRRRARRVPVEDARSASPAVVQSAVSSSARDGATGLPAVRQQVAAWPRSARRS